LIFEPEIAKKRGNWHRLNALDGKTLSQSPHLYPDLSRVLLNPNRPEFLAQVDGENLFYQNVTDAKQLWNDRSPHPVTELRILDEDTYFRLAEDSTLERRTLSANALLWQKKLSQVDLSALTLSPDYRVFALQSRDETTALQGYLFFDSGTGDYLGTLTTSESLESIFFFGDWVYAMSTDQVWGFKK
jgi:hypothetical protein